MGKIANPHDKFFKEILAKKENARDFLVNYLPSKVLNLLVLDTLEIAKDSFIEKKLKEFFSDLLYKVDISGHTGYIYILFEHKSYPYKLISIQLLRYIIEIWELHNKQRPEEPLPIVIPLVIYHGTKEWKVGDRLRDLLGEGKEELKEFIPDFRYILYDLVPCLKSITYNFGNLSHETCF